MSENILLLQCQFSPQVKWTLQAESFSARIGWDMKDRARQRQSERERHDLKHKTSLVLPKVAMRARGGY